MQVAKIFWRVAPMVSALGMVLSSSAFSQANKDSLKSECGAGQRLNVETPAGFCLVVVAEGFKFPRSITALADGRILVADMGGWTPGRGAVWILDTVQAAKTQLLEKVDRPSHIAVGPDGYVYFGTPGDIRRFKISAQRASPTAPKSKSVASDPEIVIKDLPTTGRHPLTVFEFDGNGGLFVNVGSESDNCEADAKKSQCYEAEAGGRGVIRYYPRDKATGAYRSFEVFGRGLRNSMAMVWDGDRLFAAENSRDDIEKADPRLNGDLLPPDEINIVVGGKHYGWPYCYSDRKNSPEFPDYQCTATAQPFTELPAHSAPLGMVLYKGAMFPGHYQGKLLVALHGYRATGHRIIAVDPDGGAVIGDVVRQWTKQSAGKQGAPVGMAVAPDGALLIADDKNKRVLRLSYSGPRVASSSDASQGSPLRVVAPVFVNAQNPQIPTGDISPKSIACPPIPARPTAGQKVQTMIFDRICFGCHGQVEDSRNMSGIGQAGRLALFPCDYQKNLNLLTSSGPDESRWITPGSERGPLMDRIHAKRTGLPVMPPTGELSPELRELMNEWVKSLKR